MSFSRVNENSLRLKKELSHPGCFPSTLTRHPTNTTYSNAKAVVTTNRPPFEAQSQISSNFSANPHHDHRKAICTFQRKGIASLHQPTDEFFSSDRKALQPVHKGFQLGPKRGPKRRNIESEGPTTRTGNKQAGQSSSAP